MSIDLNTPAGNTDKASTKHLVVDGRFAALLAEDFALDWAVVVEALISEPQKQAIAICSWAEKTGEPAKALLAWSRKHRKGTHRPRRRSCGQRQERHEERHGGGTNNTPAAPDISAPRRTDEVGSGSLRGVLVNPERLAETAEKLGI